MKIHTHDLPVTIYGKRSFDSWLSHVYGYLDHQEGFGDHREDANNDEYIVRLLQQSDIVGHGQNFLPRATVKHWITGFIYGSISIQIHIHLHRNYDTPWKQYNTLFKPLGAMWTIQQLTDALTFEDHWTHDLHDLVKRLLGGKGTQIPVILAQCK